MISVTYVTSSPYKREEIELIMQRDLASGAKINTRFTLVLERLAIKEQLEVNIEELVRAEVKNAYAQLRIPCLVEHGGLIFEKYAGRDYPGGLTKAMWDVLGDDFVRETDSAGLSAIARSCVGYCDGKQVVTFTGETHGQIAREPRGARAFYWDTIFMPNDPDGPGEGLTYAEIVDTPGLGLAYKIELSQSTKALSQLFEYRLNNSPELWP